MSDSDILVYCMYDSIHDRASSLRMLYFPISKSNEYSLFRPLEVVSRYRDQQLQAEENYSYVFNYRPNICKFTS